MSSIAEKNKLSDAYIDDMRLYLRISATALDAEIIDLVNAARKDLLLGGVHPDHVFCEEDALIKRAISTYLKAEFGLDNDDSEKYHAAYTNLKTRLTLSNYYKNPKEASVNVG